MSSYPQVGKTYWVVKAEHRKNPSASKYILPFGCHYGILVDAPKYQYGQAFTSKAACLEGAWALRKEGMDAVYDLQVVPAVFEGGDLFVEVKD